MTAIRRLLPATLLSLGLVGQAVAQTADRPPTPPTGLSASAYGETAGEIAWRRSTDDRGAVRGYEVTRDGAVVVPERDALSHVARALAPGTTYRYGVTAIDSAGQRSATSFVTLTTRGEAGAGGTPTPVGALATPSGLRAVAYSRTNGEIFWSRPTLPGIRHVVVRDGRTIATTDGVSHYDDDLAAGRRYVYEVTAIDREGRRSAPASVALATDGDPSGDGTAAPAEPVTPTEPDAPPPVTPPPAASASIEEPSDYYRRDGYGTVDVVRVDLRTVTTPGSCTVDDDAGCTLDDVNADNDPHDDLTVEIPVHFRADDFPDDGEGTNAELRQRGASARLSDQKSYRVELKGRGVRWRGEDRLQLNKHPYDPSKIRNKLAFDLMAEIPDLPSMRTQFVDLWIDDGEGPVPYGLFTHIEAAVGEYLENRGWDEDDRLYKAEKFVFADEDLAFMALDEDGEAVDEDAFETRLEIKGGGDHRKLVEMILAVNDRERAFADVFARYFDEENVVTWVAVNILLRQTDAATHNFYLYNPLGADTFYLIPWDYDQTFDFQPFPTGGFDEEALAERLNYGYARGSASNFLKQVYRLPGFHEKVLAKADELRRGPLMDSAIDERARRYTEVVAPVAGRQPDEYKFDRDIHRRFAEFVSRSHEALSTTYAIPLPPSLGTPRVERERDRVRFGWSPAHDVTGGTLTYDLEVSRSADFAPGERVFLETRIPDRPDYVQYDVPLERFPSGSLYARLVARVDRDPSRFWQISSNRADIDGERRIGIREFRVP